MAIDFNDQLPLIEFGSLKRSKKDILNRVNVLHILYTIAEENSDDCTSFFRDKLIQNKWICFLSRNEKEALYNETLSSQDLINFSWKKEGLYALLWSICLIEENIFNLDETFISNYTRVMPPELSWEDFDKKSLLRKPEAINEALDFYYMVHWSLRHKDGYGNVSSKQSMIIERRIALEWLYTNESVDWDDISLDT